MRRRICVTLSWAGIIFITGVLTARLFNHEILLAIGNYIAIGFAVAGIITIYCYDTSKSLRERILNSLEITVILLILSVLVRIIMPPENFVMYASLTTISYFFGCFVACGTKNEVHEK